MSVSTPERYSDADPGVDEQLSLGLFSPRLDHDNRAVPFVTAFLALAEVRGLGMKALRSLVLRYGDELGRVFSSADEETADALAAGKPTSDSYALAKAISKDADRLLEVGESTRNALKAESITLLSPSQVPRRILEIRDGPRWLFVQGDVGLIQHSPQIAVVGTRSATSLGLAATMATVRTLAAYPVSVVSGLAEGIDAAAHDAALRYGLPNIAVLGHGINLTFPAATAEVRRKIVSSGGAVVTEYPPNEHYRKQYFVQRNRIQAGLADLVIAVEGSSDGGTAHTIRFSAKYGRNIVGYEWAGADDLPELIRSQATGIVLQIFSEAGRRELDGIVRATVERANKSSSSLSLVERYLREEVRLRQPRSEDLDAIRRLLDELTEKPH
jgi:DNA protecting protein DprA